MSDGDKPIYEEAVDEYLAIVKGPTRVIGNGSISPPVDEEPADLLAAVRRGVESGTIKGEMWETYRGNIWMRDMEPGIYIVIGPVPDGGSET